MDFLEAVEHDQSVALRLSRKPGGRKPRGYVGRNNVRFHCPGCGFFATTTAKRLESLGGCPTCLCGDVMQVSNVRDRLAIPWAMDDAFAELAQMTPATRRAMLAEQGLTRDEISGVRDYLEPGRDSRRGGTNRCAWELGHCEVFTSGRYCVEHEGWAGV